MNIRQPIIIYLLTFLAISIIFKIFGIINAGTAEIFGYACIFYGTSVVYTSFGKKQKKILFIGSSVFLIGIILFLLSNFEFANPSRLVFPVIILISAISAFMLFLEDREDRYALFSSITLLAAGIILTLITGAPNFPAFINALANILLKYWVVLLIAAGIIFLISRDSRSG